MIELRDVCKQFGTTQVLININASFDDGKIHGLIGRNGSGKTVLLKCICGLIRPSSGSIVISGKQIGKDIEMPESFAALIENPGFLPDPDNNQRPEYSHPAPGKTHCALKIQLCMHSFLPQHHFKDNYHMYMPLSSHHMPYYFYYYNKSP